MFRYTARFFVFEAKDLKSKVLLERTRAARIKAGVHPDDLDNQELAKECGLLPPDAVHPTELREKKAELLEMLEAQRIRRIAKREAFLDWQAGQREKGAAHRLLRQAKTAEKYKRHHYHTMQGRILSVALSNSSNYMNDSEAPHTDTRYSTSECMSSAEFLVSPEMKSKDIKKGVVLSLKRK